MGTSTGRAPNSAKTSERRQTQQRRRVQQRNSGVIATRLRPPTRSAGLIARERLGVHSSHIRTRRLVYVKAPAGYGKSSLLHQWHADLLADGVSVGWLSLDRTQDDLRSFFRYAACAIREHTPDFGSELLDFLNSSRAPSPERAAAAFLDELESHPRERVLFVDDFHLLSDKDAIRAVEILLRDASPGFHLVLASREAPAFSLARLRMLGEIEEVGFEQLRFDGNEVDRFVRLTGRSLAGSEVRKLLAATEGWAAGVQLALISLAQHEDLQPFLERFSGAHHMVSDFLIDDVIENLPAATVNFLLKTSILEIFDRDLCDAVVASGDAQTHIDELSAKSLFIFSLDDEKRWFRYHHLFSEVLQRMLRARLPSEIGPLHRKASDWFAQFGYAELAFDHAVQAGDWPRAGQILEAACTGLFYEGKLGVLMRLAQKIPADILDGFPRLQLEIAWSIILEWRFDDALSIIRKVESFLAARKSEGDPTARIVEVGRIVLHRRMMLALFMDDVRALERSVVELMRDFPSDDPYLRGTLENCLVYARREMFRLNEVDQRDRAAREFFERSGSKFVLVWHEAILAPTFHLRGDTEIARNALASAVKIAEYVDGPMTPLQAMPGILLAEILYECNEIAEADELIERFGPLTVRLGFVDNLAAYYVTKARILMSLGSTEAAAGIIAEGEGQADFRGFPRLKQRLRLEKLRLAAAQGDLDVLREEMARVETPSEKARLSPGPQSLGRDESLALGWCLAALQLGQARAAIGVARRWAAFAAGRGALRTEVRLLITLSVGLLLAGDRGEALRKMRLAVQRAARPRYVASFLDGGEPVLVLLRELFSGERASDPVAAFGVELLQAFAGRADAGAAMGPTEPALAEASPDTLNTRERDVLRLAAHGDSNKEIARALGMTEGTVKWYMQQIFAKLDVRRRAQAVERARAFGFL